MIMLLMRTARAVGSSTRTPRRAASAMDTRSFSIRRLRFPVMLILSAEIARSSCGRWVVDKMQ
jgi:hypothetical protein